MTSSRTILIAGAGIGGLTAALALARMGHRVVMLEAARELSETGAGIQLSPNATRILGALGLADAIEPHAVAPGAVRIMNGRSGREIASLPLGPAAEARYGSPYWVVHRADLQHVLREAVDAQPAIVLRLGFTVLDHAAHAHGVTVVGKTRSGVIIEEKGDALIGADGLWSAVRQRLGPDAKPRFSGRMALRALIDNAGDGSGLASSTVHLWLGPGAHLVYYPIRAGAAVNVVAVVKDREPRKGWDEAVEPGRARAAFDGWAEAVREIVAAPAVWQAWSLYDLPPLAGYEGPVTLLGDAAHAMLPFLAQGGAAAIEDAAVLTNAIAEEPQDIAAALRAYEAQRAVRTARLQREAARNASRYAWRWPRAPVRDYLLGRMGGEQLLARYDWIYGWTPD